MSLMGLSAPLGDFIKELGVNIQQALSQPVLPLFSRHHGD